MHLRRFSFLFAAGLLAAPACSNLTSPSGENPDSLTPVGDTPAATHAQPPPTQPRPAPERAPNAEALTVRRILIAHDRAEGAKPGVKRTLAEARKLAAEVAEKAQAPGADFAQLAKTHSDAPDAERGGLLPPLRGDAEAELRAAAQQATVGQVSGVVVTRQGLQIFQRLR
jgi:hypothetical protein